MYGEFVVTLGKYITALDAVQESVVEKPGLTPYIGKVDIMLDGAVCGHLVGEEYGFRYEEAPIA